nr:MAG TPA: hypothetical protein [Caudoviricetes sp.]
MLARMVLRTVGASALISTFCWNFIITPLQC